MQVCLSLFIGLRDVAWIPGRKLDALKLAQHGRMHSMLRPELRDLMNVPVLHVKISRRLNRSLAYFAVGGC